MKLWTLILVGFLGVVPWAGAQVNVQLTLDEKEFLPREALIIGVRITNISGQDFALGKDNHWVHFMVETSTKSVVPRLDTMPVSGEFQVQAGKITTRYLNLAPYYDLLRPGRYRVTAVVDIAPLGLQVTSLPQEFDIVKGFPIWEQAFGVPRLAGVSNAPPDFRKYSLVQITGARQPRLYAQVSDVNNNQIYRVTFLGLLLSFSTPEIQLDAGNNLHVLYQKGSRSFLYAVINPDGRLILRQTHMYTSLRPALKKDFDGSVRVINSVRRPSEDDEPSPDSSVEPPAKLSTNAPPSPK